MTSHIRHGVPPHDLRLGGSKPAVTAGRVQTPARRERYEGKRADRTGDGRPKRTPPSLGWSGSSPSPPPTRRTGLRASSPCCSNTQPGEAGRAREGFPSGGGTRWRRHRGGSPNTAGIVPTDDSLGRSVQPASAPLRRRRARSARRTLLTRQSSGTCRRSSTRPGTRQSAR